MKIIFDIINSLFGENKPEVLAETFDPLNRHIQLLKQGKKYYVTVDDIGIECTSEENAQNEFDFRAINSNRLI